MPASAPTTHTLELDGELVVIERPTGLKASRALAILRALSRAMPGLQDALATFRRDYEANNIIELDRVQAKMRNPPEPLVVRERLDDGTVRTVPVLDEAGEPRMVPSPVDRLTAEDWAAAGGVYRIPASPSVEEIIAALFDLALETAEEHVYKLLALFTIGNNELANARRSGTLDELLEERVNSLLDDCYADELLELAVVVGETVDHHFRRKTSELGDRLGNALRLVGMGPKTPRTTTAAPSTSSDGASSSRPDSSTDSPASTPDGAPTPSSAAPTTSSSSSDTSASSTSSPDDAPSSSENPVAP